MTIQLGPEQEQLIDQAIQAGLIARVDEAVEVGFQALRVRLEAQAASAAASRQQAVQRMQEFGEKYQLSLGEPITRKLLHEQHRY